MDTDNNDNRTDVSPFWDRGQELKDAALAGEVAEAPKRKSLFFKFLVASLVVFVLSGAYAAYQVYSKRNLVSNDKIIFNLDSALFADSGRSKDFQFSVSNQNDLPLLDVKVEVVYERGKSISGSLDTVRQNFSFGDVAAKSLLSTSTPITFFGEEGDMRNINLTMSYKVAGSGGVYNKVSSGSVKISAPLVTIDLTGPSSVINENEFILEAKVKNVAQNDFVPSVINFELPTGFVLKRNASSTNQTHVELDNLTLGDEKTFQIRGNFKNSVGESRTFRVYVSAKSDQGEGAQYASARHEVSIIDTPVSVDGVIKVESREVRTASIDKPYVLDLKVNNKGNNAIDDITVNVTVDKKTLSWNSNIEELKRLNPNTSYTITLDPNQTNTKKDYKIEVFGKEKGTFDTVLLYTGVFTVFAN
jgi:hypothetical protein